MSEEQNLITFNVISKFVTELCNLYGRRYKPIALYERLISKTTIRNEKPIEKHINAFRKFCIENRDFIKSRNTMLSSPMIKYSDTVFIDMRDVFKLVSQEENDEEANQIRDSIWRHILTISALVDPAGKAKDVLRESISKKATNETEFIAGIIDKVEKNVKPNSNPMEAVSSIMSSGVFTDLIQDMNKGLQSGNLDIGKLMGAVSGIVTSMNTQQQSITSQEDTDSQSIVPNNSQELNMDVLNTMMGSLMAGLSQPNNLTPP